MNFQKCNALFIKICGDEATAQEVLDYAKRNRAKLAIASLVCRFGGWHLFMKRSPMARLALIWAHLPILERRYSKKGIPSSVFFETMEDIPIWMKDYRERTGKTGLEELNWLVHHMNMRIFKLGRLQFQLWINEGKPAIFIHIPRGGALDPAACDDSIARAEEFFKRYFPRFPRNYYCDSWLLYSKNKLFMESGSNIIRFAERFEIIEEGESPSQTFLWLFKIRASNEELIETRKKTGAYADANALPQSSRLQQRAAAYIAEGGILGDAKGKLIYGTLQSL